MAPWFLLWRPSLVSVCGVKSRVPCSGAATFANVAPQPRFPHGGAEVLFISVAPKPGFPLWRPTLVSVCGAQALLCLAVALSIVPFAVPKHRFLLWRPSLVFVRGAKVLSPLLAVEPGFLSCRLSIVLSVAPKPGVPLRRLLFPHVAPKPGFLLWRLNLACFCGA